MEWHFREDSPIYAQLVEQITQKIIVGDFIPGQRFPSVRELAQEAGVNPNTMQRAMQELERQGLLFSVRTSGRFVTEDIEMVSKTREAMAQKLIEQFLAQMAALGCDKAEVMQLLEEKSEGGDSFGDPGMQELM